MRIFAHRGARAHAPENTLAAFELARQLGADGIELDVQLSKDGQLVICHDPTIDRTSNGLGWIKDHTLSELKRYDFGGWFSTDYQGQKLLTLREFLEWFKPIPMQLNIEIKNGPVIYPGIEEKVLQHIHQAAVGERTLISSFYHPSLKRVKELDPTIKTGVLFECRPINPFELLTATQADFLHPFWQSLDRDWCIAAQAAGIAIHTYTINTWEEYTWVQDFGVASIFTDDPGRFNTHGELHSLRSLPGWS